MSSLNYTEIMERRENCSNKGRSKSLIWLNQSCWNILSVYHVLTGMSWISISAWVSWPSSLAWVSWTRALRWVMSWRRCNTFTRMSWRRCDTSTGMFWRRCDIFTRLSWRRCDIFTRMSWRRWHTFTKMSWRRCDSFTRMSWRSFLARKPRSCHWTVGAGPLHTMPEFQTQRFLLFWR